MNNTQHEVKAEKTKLMTKNADNINTDIRVCGEKLETVGSFGSIVSDDGSRPEILSRTAQATVAMTKPRPIWNVRNITLNFGDHTDALTDNPNIFIFSYA